MKKCWQGEDYQTRLTNHLRKIALKGARRSAELRSSGAIKFTEESRRHWSEGQRRRFQRPEERRKLEAARELSYRVLSQQARAKLMNKAFLAKYGSYAELTKMGLRSPKRKPNKLELKVARLLGEEWEYVGDGRLEIGGLIPDFVHRTKRQVLEVLGCYFHSCPAHFPEVKRPNSASPSYKESVYKRNGYEVIFIWEHDVKGRALAFKMAGVRDSSLYSKPPLTDVGYEKVQGVYVQKTV